MKKLFFFWIFITALFSISQRVNGMSEQCAVSDEYDLYDGYNFEDIDNIVKDSTQGSFDFTYIIKQLFSGDKGVLYNGYELVKNSIYSQLSENRSHIIGIIVLALSMALLSNILVIFTTNNYWETGFFVLYLMLINSLMISFITLMNIGKELIGSVVRFMECLVPSFFLAIGISNGYSTSTGLCAVTLTVMTIIEKVIVNILLPAISIFVAISLVNSIKKDNNM